MMRFFPSFLPTLFILLNCQYINSCKNFLVQHCTDIPIGFNSISTIKCIQLIPIKFDLLIDYSVENYIIKKVTKCYDIVSYNSSTTVLFSNECHELCPEQYCLLFDNQPNTSIINIFYSQLSIYESNNLISNNISSYDYFLFDKCSEVNRKSQILLIVVYVLSAIVVLLTIAVISKYLISHYKRGIKGGKWRPYDWRWIVDCLLCQIRSKTVPTNNQEMNSNNSEILQDTNQSKINENRLNSRNKFNTSIPLHIISNDSSNNTTKRPNYSNGNSSDQRYHNFSSENNTPILPHRSDTVYVHVMNDVENNNSPEETKKTHHSQFLPVLRTISAKISDSLPSTAITNGYIALEAKPSPEIMNFRL